MYIIHSECSRNRSCSNSPSSLYHLHYPLEQEGTEKRQCLLLRAPRIMLIMSKRNKMSLFFLVEIALHLRKGRNSRVQMHRRPRKWGKQRSQTLEKVWAPANTNCVQVNPSTPRRDVSLVWMNVCSHSNLFLSCCNLLFTLMTLLIGQSLLEAETMSHLLSISKSCTGYGPEQTHNTNVPIE